MNAIDDELSAAAIRVIGPLRQGLGLDARAAERLRRALRAAAAAWADATVISRASANLFVDLAPGIEACGYGYRGEEADAMRDFSVEVADLVRACVELSYAELRAQAEAADRSEEDGS